MKDEIRTATAAVHDRDKDLGDTRRALVECTDDLVATRKLLIERTARLERMVAQAEILSSELAEAKANAATAEPTSDSPETTPPTP